MLDSIGWALISCPIRTFLTRQRNRCLNPLIICHVVGNCWELVAVDALAVSLLHRWSPLFPISSHDEVGTIYLWYIPCMFCEHHLLYINYWRVSIIVIIRPFSGTHVRPWKFSIDYNLSYVTRSIIIFILIIIFINIHEAMNFFQVLILILIFYWLKFYSFALW